MLAQVDERATICVEFLKILEKIGGYVVLVPGCGKGIKWGWTFWLWSLVWAQWWLFEGEGGFGSFDAETSCLNLGEEADGKYG